MLFLNWKMFSVITFAIDTIDQRGKCLHWKNKSSAYEFMGFFVYVVCPCKATFHFDFGGWRKKRQLFFIPEFLRLRTPGVMAWMILYCEGLSCAWDMSQRPWPVPAGGQQHSPPPQRWYPAVSSDMANVPWRAAATWTGNHGFNPFDTLCFYFLEMLRLIFFKIQMKSVYGFLCVELGWKRFHGRTPHFSSVVASASAQWWKYPLATSHLPSGLLSATR